MTTVYFNPRPALAEFVETICIMEHDFQVSEWLSPIYSFVPAHTRFLCFYLEDPIKVKKETGVFEQRARSMIIGPQTIPVTLDVGQKYVNVVVMLKPCGLYRLLGIPLNEILDQDFDAYLILGKEINLVVEQLVNSQHAEDRNGIVQEYLLHKVTSLKPALPIDRAMDQLVKAKGNIPMDLLASKSYLSVRQFERQSLERIGTSPKLFARIVRFSESYKCKQRDPTATWTKIAHRFGYYDQMHLIRDFRQFAGVNPSTIVEEELLHSVRFNSVEP